MAEMSTALSTGWDRYFSQAGYTTQALGIYMQGQSYLEHGYAQQAAAQFAAQQMRQNASDAAAVSQRAAVDIGRESDYIASKQLAVAAASGGGASDPTVMNLIARSRGEMAYRQAVTLYSGASKQRELQMAAAGEEFTGREEKRMGQMAALSADIGAMSTLARGGVSLRAKYGGGGPQNVDAAKTDSWDM